MTKLPTLELLPSGTDAGDDVGHVAEYGGEQQESEQKLEDDEHVLSLAAWSRQVTYRGQRQCTPIVALQVLFDNVRSLTVNEHPVLAAEPVVLADDVEETAVPVEDDEQVVDEAGGAKQVGVVGVALRPVHEGPETVDLDQTEGAQDAVEAYGQVEEVQWQQAETVDVERGGVHVVVPQLDGVSLQYTVLQVASAEVEHDVHQIQEVRQVVQAEPNQDRVL